jgi:hypothetical protein
MIDAETTTIRRTGSPALRLPMQARPVHRGASAAVLADGGVEADWGWSDIWDTAKKLPWGDIAKGAINLL